MNGFRFFKHGFSLRHFTSNSLNSLRSRLLYQSKKRGILENELILTKFAEASLHNMNEIELREYDRIINGGYAEWDLYYFLTGRKDVPPDLAKNLVFIKIRSQI